MFIIWGEYNKDKERGVVGDKCPNCGRITALSLTQRYRVSHLYFLPLGSGKLTATILTCSECNGQAISTLEKFAQVLPKQYAKEMSAIEILEQTNPGLVETLAHRARLEQNARSVRDVAPGAPDPRVELAFTLLAELNSCDQGVIALQSRLAQWGNLDVTAQSKLLRDVEDLVDEQQQHETAVRFLRLMEQKFKPDVDPGLAVLAFMVTVVFGVSAVFYFLTDVALVVGIIVTVAAAIGVSSLTHRQLQRHLHRKFFRLTFLPEAHRQGVGVARALAILRQVNEQSDPELYALAKATPLLHEILKKEDSDGNLDAAVADIVNQAPPTTRRYSGPPEWIKPVVMLGVVLVCVGFTFWFISADKEKNRIEAEKRNAYLAPFLPRLPEYTAKPAERDIQPPYRSGKVIPINRTANNQIDGIIFDLPESLRAAQPEDVGTIVWLEWGSNKVGEYSDRKDALVITCKVTLIDKSKRLIISERVFTGGPPPQRREHNQPNFGSTPTGEILGWLVKLPLR